VTAAEGQIVTNTATDRDPVGLFADGVENE
jgi:hypothetical protein